MFNPNEFQVHVLYEQVFVNLTEVMEKEVEILDSQWNLTSIGNHVLNKMDIEFLNQRVTPENMERIKFLCSNELNDFIHRGIIRRKKG
jgi:hypothetical protein